MNLTVPAADPLLADRSDLHIELVRFAHTMHRIRSTPTQGPSLPPSSIPLLAVLDHFGAMRSRDLADATFLAPSTVSRQVDTLVRGGFVRRTVDPQDGRASLLELTVEGAHVLAERRRHFGRLIGDVTRAWPSEDLERFVDLLTRFNDDAWTRLPAERDGASITDPRTNLPQDAGITTTEERTA